MAEESEKRFHAIMDKLFHSPSPIPTNNNHPSGPGVPLVSRGVKRPTTSSALAVHGSNSRGSADDNSQKSGGSSQAKSPQVPLCRPWDRGDLLKRLATFKSMTWFAKPQAVSAVNCARRGWINVDMDTIGCEACGARLLFSTPPSWTKQQVEKAALVFSLKLDGGHKLLCPWVNNACDEALALFPPKPIATLVDEYKRRCSALLQLAALPVISSVTLSHLKSPQLEEFLKESPAVEPLESAYSSSKDFISYYQAQKLISLLGWEPRTVPYIVDCKNKLDQSVNDISHRKVSDALSNGQSRSINVYSSHHDEIIGENDDPESSAGVISDPNSVILDCTFCSASVGLWAFHTIPRPLEFLRLVGHTESATCKDGAPMNELAVNKDHVDSREAVVSSTASASTSMNEGTSNLRLTIAGGPPPTKQNYRATISLPIIGQNLRARLTTNSELRHLSPDKNSSQLSGDQHVALGGTDVNGQVTSKINMPASIETESIMQDCSSKGNDADSNPEKDGPSGNDETSEDRAAIIAEDENCKQHDKQVGRQNNSGMEPHLQPGNNNTVPLFMGKDVEYPLLYKAADFDPVRQHRHFCPWIASNGNSSPGWQQTLSALQREKETSTSSSNDASLIEVDDPIASVKKLLTPPSKRRKLVRPG